MAVLLAGVFAFPMLLQPLHIAHHRAHQDPGRTFHNPAHPVHDGSCPGHAAGQGLKESRHGTVITLPVDDHRCYICDYRFPVQEPPAGTIRIASPLPCQNTGQVPLTEPVYLGERHRITSRGPPAI